MRGGRNDIENYAWGMVHMNDIKGETETSTCDSFEVFDDQQVEFIPEHDCGGTKITSAEVQELKSRIAHLSKQDRLELISFLLDELQAEDDPDWCAAWIEEVFN